ncbi:MAG TPA: TonB-dependent receptor [Gemmatimonadales bacterium]|nr:TonB-dependent receptor [Gemmatimonadales bacterium]
MRVVVLLASAIVVGSLSAQTPSDTFKLAPVVVTATGIPTRADQLPVSVTVLKGADLAARGIRTVSQALRLVPGAAVVETSSFGSQTSLFLRGGESDYAKVLVDGVPQSQPGVGFDYANLTTDNIDRIEVVSGPVSVLYGSDAVTGVVQIFTKTGQGGAHGTLSAHAGTYGSADYALSAGGGNERASWSLSGSRFTSDGSLPVNNHYRNGAMNGRLVLRPGDSTEAALSVRYDDGLYFFPTTYPGAPLSNNQHDLDRGPSVGLDMSHGFRAVSVHLIGTWHRDNLQYAIGPNDSTDSFNLPFSSNDWITRQSLEGRAEVHLSGSDVLTAGSSFEHQRMEGTTLGQVRTRDDGSVFAELVTGFGRPLGVTLGARMEDNQRFGTFGTYRAGVSYRLSGSTRVLGSLGSAFKEPSLFQNFAQGFITGNENLKPEHSFSWEGGVEQDLGSGVAVQATYFDQRFRNQIAYSSDTVPNYQNIDGSTARGIEISLHAPLGAWGALSAGYTYLATNVVQGDTTPGSEFQTGHPLIRRPAHSATASLSAALPFGGSAGVAVSYVGRRDDIDFNPFPPQRVSLAAYGRLDLSAQVPVRLVPGLAIDARVDNALNAGYDEVASFRARGRTIVFGGSWTVGSH